MRWLTHERNKINYLNRFYKYIEYKNRLKIKWKKNQRDNNNNNIGCMANVLSWRHNTIERARWQGTKAHTVDWLTIQIALPLNKCKRMWILHSTLRTTISIFCCLWICDFHYYCWYFYDWHQCITIQSAFCSFVRMWISFIHSETLLSD